MCFNGTNFNYRGAVTTNTDIICSHLLLPRPSEHQEVITQYLQHFYIIYISIFISLLAHHPHSNWYALPIFILVQLSVK